MLTKWFGTRLSRSSEQCRSFRPALEALEDRLPPSSLQGSDHGHGNGNGNDNGNGGGPPAQSSPPGHNNVHDQNNVHYNIHINNSFNGDVDAFNNLSATAGSGALSPFQIGALIGLLNLTGSISASSSQLGMLINDEIALAVDTYLSNTLGSSITGLDTAISTLKTDISNNPLDSTLIGQVIGTVAYDITYDALTAVQPTL